MCLKFVKKIITLYIVLISVLLKLGFQKTILKEIFKFFYNKNSKENSFYIEVGSSVLFHSKWICNVHAKE